MTELSNMGAGSSDLMTVLLHEHSLLSSDIQSRVDLQNKNLSLSLVVTAAIGGYIVDAWNKTSFQLTMRGELMTLVPISVLISLAFIWRHLDHDANIIDKAEYIERTIRPQISWLTGSSSILGFERYLRIGRGRRTKKIGLFSLLGNDHFVMFGLMFVFLTFGWYMRWFVPDHAGTASNVFNILLYLVSALTLITIQMSVATMLRYSRISSVPAQHAPSADP